jgi:choline dehydrogenase
MADHEFEFVVVGAGSAGCVLASRLSEDASVLLIEAGPMDAPPNSYVPDQAPLLIGSSVDWGYVTVPQAGAAGRALLMPHGFMVGGSSSINGLLWTRGDPTDFDGWAQGGAPGWSYADLEPYFRRVEGYADEGAAHLGTAGPVYLENRVGHGVNPAALDFVAAAEVRGHRRLNDFSGPGGAAGAGIVTVNVRDGRRFGAREAYLEPALSRDTLELWADTRAVQVNLEKGRCTGVTVLRDGVSTVVRASREVVLCASVVETPKLLMLSGIGPADHLLSIGIPVRHALSGVGANFHDHASVGWQFNTSREVPLTDYVFDAAVFFCSEPDWVGADLETLFYVRSFQNGQFGAGIGMRTGLLRPMSRGTIRLRSSDPTEPAVLDPRLFSVDSDVDRLAVGVRESLAIAATAPVDSWIAGPDTNDLRPVGFSDGRLRTDMGDDQLRAWLRANVQTFAHMAGGCRMGLDENAVVDPELGVHGLDALRVVDISVLPAVVSGHPQAAVMAVAERAADLILGRAPLHAGSRAEAVAPA